MSLALTRRLTLPNSVPLFDLRLATAPIRPCGDFLSLAFQLPTSHLAAKWLHLQSLIIQFSRRTIIDSKKKIVQFFSPDHLCMSPSLSRTSLPKHPVGSYIIPVREGID